MPATIEIFTRPGCGYCSAAKSLLTRKGAAFTEYNAGIDPSFRTKMLERSNGGRTFPQIFIDGLHVGGCDELYALDGTGKLDTLLESQKLEGQKVTP
ncbi:MAG: glutaredoxin 3 [Xanthobacteraceae bacterium]|nr:glutaredoxin 3 [Xanthobacteraceae bacterium]